MRHSCIFCTRKHIASAISLLKEYYQGYGHHLQLAWGELDQAEAESMDEYPELAKEICLARRGLMQVPPVKVYLEDIIIHANKLAGDNIFVGDGWNLTKGFDEIEHLRLHERVPGTVTIMEDIPGEIPAPIPQ